MTDVGDLLTHWNTSPPMHVTMAGLLRALAGTTEPGPGAKSTPEEAKAFVDHFKGMR